MIGAYEILVAARGRIRRGWTRKALARAGCIECEPEDPKATCWCAEGAIEAAAKALNASYFLKQQAFHTLRSAIGMYVVYEWNDRSNQALTLAAFDRAVASVCGDSGGRDG